MDQNRVAAAARRMTEARAVLIRDFPFFGHLSMGLQFACASCGTACTDGERLIMDPEFAEKLKTDREMQLVILHEVLHCALEHCTRRGDRDSELYNIACDIVVNSVILGMWGLDRFRVADGELMHLAPDGNEGREYNAEEVYDMLQKNGKGSPAGPDLPPALDRHDIWKAVRNRDAVRENWNRKIREAAAACPEDAKTPPMIRRIVKKLKQRSKVDWRQVLHDFLQHDSCDYTFLPPDRRFSDGDFFLPAYNPEEDRESAKEIWVCMDTSASISKEQLEAILAEVRDAMRQAGLAGILSFFDTGITEPAPFATEEELDAIVPKGGGGTSFHVIFEYLKKHLYPELPRAILVFTDGYVWCWPKEEAAMGVPVLWVIVNDGNTKVPWGRVTELPRDS